MMKAFPEDSIRNKHQTYSIEGPPLARYTNNRGSVLVMSKKITCPVCNQTGIMILKKTSTKTSVSSSQGGGNVWK